MALIGTLIVMVSLFCLGYLAGGMNQSSRISELTDELLEAKQEIDALRVEGSATDLFMRMDDEEAEIEAARKLGLTEEY